MRPTDPRLLRQLAPARRPLSGVLAGGVVGSVLVLAQAWVVTGLVIAALRGEHVVLWATLAASVLAARAACGWVVDVLAARAAALVGTDLRRRLVSALLRRRAGGEPERSAGELAVLVTRGVAASEPYLTRYLPALVLAAVLPALTVVAMATQDLLSAGIVLATLPLVPVFGALVGLATRDRAESQWRAMSSLSGHFVDVVRGLPTLVAFRRADAQSRTIRDITDRYRVATMRTLRIAFASSAVLELVATLSVALVAVVVGVRLAAGSLDLHTALVVLLLAPEAYWPLRRVGAEFHAAAEGVATFERADELLGGAPEEPVLSGPTGATDDALAVRDLTVRYPGRELPAVTGFTAVIPARGVTALVGPSGCGKTTVLATLAGLVAPEAGTVQIGDHPVGGPGWRSRIAWLAQRPVFVPGSVAENLRLGAAAASDDELWSALRRVALEERVRALPSGLATSVGEDGLTLSAGERARLALARVVVAVAAGGRTWVFLDEPSAHLDEITERIVADTVAELGRTCGVVVVAHRPVLRELADHVVTMPAPCVPEAPRAAPSTLGTVHPPASPPAVRVPEPVETPTRSPRASLLGSTIVGALASASGVALTATAGWLIVQASYRPAILTLLVAIVGVRTFGLARPVLRYVERLTSHDVALRLLAERRVQVYDALVPLTPGRLGRRRGDVLSAIVDDVDSVVDRELRVRMPVRAYVIVSLLATLVGWWLLPAAGAVVALTCLLGGGLGHLLARAGARTSEELTTTGRAELSAFVVDTTQQATELVMWQAEPAVVAAVGSLSHRLGRAATRASVWLGLGRALVLLVAGIAVATTALLGSPAVASGQLSGPMMALLVLLPLALADVALPMADAGAFAARTRAAAGRLDALELLVPAVTEPPDPLEAAADHDLRVDDVSAAWGDTRALAHLSLAVAPGERLAVVGPSGSGKSTLAALLLRFVDPTAGRVALGGVPLDRLRLDDVRRRVGLVDDDPHVFATTLVENIRLARPTASDADVAAALRQACLGPWLDALPAGLDTWLGDGHAHVSGGERARIGVARSLLAAQSVVVLDEPTAHLDHATATELAREVLSGDAERSVVWITHGTVGLDIVDSVVDLGTPSGTPSEVARRSATRWV